MKINSKTKIELYYQTLRIRLIEEAIAKEYSKQEMRCPIHLSVGQESVAVAVCSNLKKNDLVVSSHRAHAHYISKGGSIKKMIAELYLKNTGCSKGRTGSMHLNDRSVGFVASIPIVASNIPIAVGLAKSIKMKKENKIVVVFFGEAATEEGVFFESINFAQLFQLPIMFICENNGYSVYSSKDLRFPKSRDNCKIVSGFGLKSIKLDGSQLEKNYKIISEASNMARKNKPVYIELETYRFLEHCGPNNDDKLNYRSKNEILNWKKKDPINVYKNTLLKKNIIKNDLIDIFEKKIKKEINSAFKFAKISNYPIYDKKRFMDL
ncbi:MAG: acetoin dehydrogenase [Rhodospirillaceae bacterium]|nr:acetoin dehydrogenase [Rhodospirillaceae bacterium]|tara:strand:- start:2348 stop:3313 length:966 start_codon:yes stop_codon:yes gene_type:complete